MKISQASPVAQKVINTSASTATVCISVLALFNVGGRVLAGFLSDRIGSVNTLTLTNLIAITGMARLTRCSEGTLILFIGFALAGLFGPGIAGNIVLKTNSYNNAFLLAMSLSLLGIVLTFIYRKLNTNN
jgi:predicted MFS family arabinose efflux permease